MNIKLKKEQIKNTERQLVESNIPTLERALRRSQKYSKELISENMVLSDKIITLEREAARDERDKVLAQHERTILCLKRKKNEMHHLTYFP